MYFTCSTLALLNCSILRIAAVCSVLLVHGSFTSLACLFATHLMALQTFPPVHILAVLKSACLQALYSYATSTSAANAPADRPAAAASLAMLPELHVEGFDAEQVWLQLDMASAQLVRRAKRLLKKAGPEPSLLTPETEEDLSGQNIAFRCTTYFSSVCGVQHTLAVVYPCKAHCEHPGKHSHHPGGGRLFPGSYHVEKYLESHSSQCAILSLATCTEQHLCHVVKASCAIWGVGSCDSRAFLAITCSHNQDST